MEGTKNPVQSEPPVRNTKTSQERQMFREMFLGRLARINDQHSADGPELSADARRLIDRALYSTYWDCVRLGLRDEARVMLKLPAD